MNDISYSAVLAALSQVEDPDFKKDLVSLNMIRNLKVEGRKVSFTLMLTTPACPLKEAIKNACVTAVKTLVSPDAEVEVTVTAETRGARGGKLAGVKNVVAVASGKGGVGKSTVAANLAVGLAHAGASVGLLDADLYGPSMPTMFNLRGQTPLVRSDNGKERIVPFVRYGVRVMSMGFLAPEDQAVVWRGPMVSKALQQLAFDTDWGELDYLVVDLPPGTGDIHITMAQQLDPRGVVIVTTPQPVALADARRAAAMFRIPGVSVPILGVVENMAFFSPPDAPEKKYYIFGAEGGKTLAEELGVPLLAQIPITEAVRFGGDAGRPAALAAQSPEGAAFLELAGNVARALAVLN
ncbi:MAG: Mrp/NBP35 family ATP-binding protein [Bacteroidia bacterium]|nr:Mrp/NBP35 family ATP-binding protein [Bacteroidia bacterium]